MQSTDSTQQEAQRWRGAGAPLPFAIVANQQTAGRGTGQRQWLSPEGGLYLTVALALSPQTPVTFAGFLLGVATAEILQESGVRCGLKWPNDLLYAADGKSYGKVAGILGEAHGDTTYVGIGINLRTPEGKLVLPSDGAPFPAATLEAHAIAKLPAEKLVAAIVSRTRVHQTSLENAGPKALLRLWEKLCVHRDRSVSFRDQDGTVFEGRFLGLEDDGAAIVMAKGQRRTVYAGELRCFWGN